MYNNNHISGSKPEVKGHLRDSTNDTGVMNHHHTGDAEELKVTRMRLSVAQPTAGGTVLMLFPQ